jgi:TonB family protein
MSPSRPSALASLDESLALPYESLGELNAVQPVQIQAIIKKLKQAEEAARSLRTYVNSVLPQASWESREELEELIVRVERILATRSRILALATELEHGRIVHRREFRVEQLNRLRKQALDELRSWTKSEADPPTLPGPEAEQWIDWACGLREPEDAESLQALRNGYALLDDFVADLEPGMWLAARESESWSPNDEEVGNLIDEVGEQLRTRLLSLAAELECGRIVHHRALRVRQLSELREQAIEELRSQAERGQEPPNTLPGPEAEKWIEWACGLKEPEDAESLQTLRSGFPHLDDFIANLERDMWRAGGSPKLGDNGQGEPSGQRTSRPDEPVTPQAIPMESNGAETVAWSDGPQGVTSQDLTPRRTQEQVEPIGEEEQAPLARTMGSGEDPVGEIRRRMELSLSTADNPDETSTPGAFSDIAAQIKRIAEGKWRLPLLVAGVLVLLVLGVIFSRAFRNHARNNSAKAVERKVNQLTPSTTESEGSDQSGILPSSEANPPSATPEREKQVEAKVTTKPTPEASKRDDATLSSSVISIPNDATRFKDKKASGREAEVPDAAPPPLPGGVSNNLAKVGANVPAVQPRLAAQPAKAAPAVVQGAVIHQVAPRFPAEARRNGVQGTVVLRAVVAKDGSVLKVRLVSGSLVLAPEAMAAVMQWRFNPFYRDGQPVEGETEVKVKFR